MFSKAFSINRFLAGLGISGGTKPGPEDLKKEIRKGDKREKRTKRNRD